MSIKLFQVRRLVRRHVDRRSAVEARHQHLQQEAGAALLHPREHASQVRNLGRLRSLHLHHLQPHQVRNHQRGSRHHPDPRPAGLPDQDEGRASLSAQQGLQALLHDCRHHRVQVNELLFLSKKYFLVPLSSLINFWRKIVIFSILKLSATF
jgi:hypothetical protein